MGETAETLTEAIAAPEQEVEVEVANSVFISNTKLAAIAVSFIKKKLGVSGHVNYTPALGPNGKAGYYFHWNKEG